MSGLSLTDLDAIVTQQEAQLEGLHAALAKRAAKAKRLVSLRERYRAIEQEMDAKKEEQARLTKLRDSKLAEELEREEAVRQLEIDKEVEALAIQQIELEEITSERLRLDSEVIARLATLAAIDDIKQHRQKLKTEKTRETTVSMTDREESMRQRKRILDEIALRKLGLVRERQELDQMLRARNIHPEAPSDIVLAAERFVGGEYLKRIEDLEAEKTSLISNATIAHPLIPTECWLPYGGSVQIQPSFRETLPIVQSCLHSIIHHALAKCFTLSERRSSLEARMERSKHLEAAEEAIRNEEFRQDTLSSIALSSRNEIIDQVVHEMATRAAEECIASEKSLNSSAEEAIISCFPGLAGNKTAFVVTLRDLAHRRTGARSSGYADYRQTLPLMTGASSNPSGGSILAATASFSIVLYQIPCQRQPTAVLRHFPATATSTDSCPALATKIDKIKGHVNASDAWLTGVAKYLTATITTSTTAVSDKSAVAVEKHGWLELGRWQKLQWATLPVASQSLRVSSSQYADTLCTAVSKCGKLLASGHLGGRIMVWDAVTSVCVATLDFPAAPVPERVPVDSIGVKSLEFDGSGGLLCARYSDNSISLWQRSPQHRAPRSSLIARSHSADHTFETVWKCMHRVDHAEKLSYCGFIGSATPFGTPNSLCLATVAGTLTVYVLSTGSLPLTSKSDYVAEYQRAVSQATAKSWSDHLLAGIENVVAPAEVRGIYALRAKAWRQELVKLRRDRLRKTLRKVVASLPWLQVKVSSSVESVPQIPTNTAPVLTKASDVDAGEAVRMLAAAYAERMDVKSRIPLIQLAPSLSAFQPAPSSISGPTLQRFHMIQLFGHSCRVVYCGKRGEDAGFVSVDATGHVLLWPSITASSVSLGSHQPITQINIITDLGSIVERPDSIEEVLFPKVGPNSLQLALSRISSFGPVSVSDDVIGKDGQPYKRKLQVSSATLLQHETLLALAAEDSVQTIPVLQSYLNDDGSLARLTVVPHLPVKRVGVVSAVANVSDGKRLLIVVQYPSLGYQKELLKLIQFDTSLMKAVPPVIDVEIDSGDESTPAAKPSVTVTNQPVSRFRSHVAFLLYKGRLRVFVLTTGAMLNDEVTVSLTSKRFQPELTSLSLSLTADPLLSISGPLMPDVAVYKLGFCAQDHHGELSDAGVAVCNRVTANLAFQPRMHDFWSTSSLHSTHIARGVVLAIVEAVCIGCTSTVRDIVGNKE